jgi:hypothetical protein
MLKILISICLVVIIGLGSTDALLVSKLSNNNSTSEAQSSNDQYVAYSKNTNLSPDTTTTTPSSTQTPSSGSTPVSTAPSNDTNTTTASSQAVDTATTNWAGYVSTGGTYTAVSGTWTIPTVTADDNSVSADATWIGIGGITSTDLIQVGTQNLLQNGQITSSTFYEQLPDTSENIPTITVSPGDTVTASISEISSGEWSISIKDMTNGESYSNVEYYDSANSSADWIEEAPTDSNGVIPLDKFGSVGFANGSTVENGSTVSIADSNAEALVMENGEGEALTSTSAITSGGNFTVTRTDASADTVDTNEPGTTYIPRGRSSYEPGLRGEGGDY